jgi:hypothetical protein
MPTRSSRAAFGLCCALLAALAGASAEAPATRSFDSQPWLEDLSQIRAAVAAKYANLQWQVSEREVDLNDLFARAQTRLEQATSEAEARAAIERLTRSFGDGHVGVRWPRTAAVAAGAGTRTLCERLGYDSEKGGRALGPHLEGYESLSRAVTSEFPAGLVQVAGRKVAILRIGLFGPQSSPEVCASALQALALAPDAACDDACTEKVESAAYTILSRDLESRIRMLRKLGARVLLIDLTGNGGGSEWAEAAARMVSPLKLRSERRGFVRGEHWSRNWDSLAKELRAAAASASDEDKPKLLEWAAAAEHARSEADTPCPSEPLWSGRHLQCEWLGRAGYATGLLGEGDAAALRKKPWGRSVFTPAEYEFTERVWDGPLIVLVDGGTGSAAEEFAAVLQDNRAALIVGSPTVGAGCGHTEGGTPTTLTHSGAILELPDCARLRADGSNEVGGIDPDVLVGFRLSDGLPRKALRLSAVLPRATAAAVHQCAAQRCTSGEAGRLSNQIQKRGIE